MVAGGEQSGYGILTVREQLWMFTQFYGLESREGWRAGRRADRGGRHAGPAAPARQHPVDRPAPEDEHGPRPAQRPVDPVPRRADARPRRRRRPRDPRPRARLEGGGARAGRSCSRPTTWPRPTSCASGSRSSTTGGSSPSARPTSSRSASRASRSSGSRSTTSTVAPRRSPGCRASCRRRSRRTSDPEQQRVAVNLVLEEDGGAGRGRHARSAASGRRSSPCASRSPRSRTCSSSSSAAASPRRPSRRCAVGAEA